MTSGDAAPVPAMRFRPVKVKVQFLGMVDDGENLAEAGSSDLFIPWAGWAAWAGGGWRQTLTALADQAVAPPQAPEGGGGG